MPAKKCVILAGTKRVIYSRNINLFLEYQYSTNVKILMNIFSYLLFFQTIFHDIKLLYDEIKIYLKNNVVRTPPYNLNIVT